MNGAPLNAWGGAQDRFHQEVATTFGMYREVTRLDNRIDEIVIGDELVRLYTYSTNAIWTPPIGLKKIIVDCISGSSGGGRSNDGGSGGAYRPGQGGYSGGWSKKTFLASELPSSVPITIGAGGAGGNSDGETGDPGGNSSFGTLLSSNGATGSAYGTGTQIFRVRGGTGGAIVSFNNVPATYGGDGSFGMGGEPGKPDGSGNPGMNGRSLEAGQIGLGSGGGGGALKGGAGNGGRGGDGGWPAGPGGGGGGYESFGTAGNGGKGASGAVYITAYIEDTAGLPPSTPTGVTVTNIGTTSARVSWTASTDDIAVARYVVTVNGNEAGRTTGVSLDLTGLTTNTTYAVSVHAVDLGLNESSKTPVVNFTTL
ncbi:fibronectin type III domain-containing protein [Rhodococcus aetherivorans]|uniref:fibronectin type III domain-containing protein n=1 Tax=Rhodococcus aetherivorans TaxID=191292 RepID=UPI00045D1010|nr:fibronectin type III domain-containing protein [Rhodococcus aetherivorans]KDE14264.1 hypothetical protein N505_0105450 [Rhodococcus aetherivorans]